MPSTEHQRPTAGVTTVSDVMAVVRARGRPATRMGPLNNAEVLLGGLNSTQSQSVTGQALSQYLESCRRSPNYRYWIRKELLATALFDLGETSAVAMSLCNVEMNYQRPELTRGRKPLVYRYRCDTTRCPFCSRRTARRRARKLCPAFTQALRDGHSIYRFELTQVKLPAENAREAQQRLRNALAKLRAWLKRQPAFKFGAVGIDIVCGSDGYHVHAHVVYAGSKLDAGNLAEKWAACSEGTKCRPKVRSAAGPALLHTSDRFRREEVFRAVFYAIKAEISTPVAAPSFGKWAQAIVDLKGRGQLYSTWGIPKQAKRTRKYDDIQDAGDEQCEQSMDSDCSADVTLTGILRDLPSVATLPAALGAVGQLNNATRRNNYDSDFLRTVALRGAASSSARERRRFARRQPPLPDALEHAMTQTIRVTFNKPKGTTPWTGT